MHANQTDVQKILGGVQQYVVPLFQRPYSWETRQWSKLWADLAELCEEPKPRNHFIGSIVTMPERSVPEGVSKFVLIDGQQRLWGSYHGRRGEFRGNTSSDSPKGST